MVHESEATICRRYTELVNSFHDVGVSLFTKPAGVGNGPNYPQFAIAQWIGNKLVISTFNSLDEVDNWLGHHIDNAVVLPTDEK